MRTIKRRIDQLEAHHHLDDDTVEIVTVLQRPDGTRYETHRGRATRAELDDAAATMRAKVDAQRAHYAAAPPLTLADIERMSIMQLICAGYANAAIDRLEHYRQKRDVDVQDIELEQQLRAMVAHPTAVVLPLQNSAEVARCSGWQRAADASSCRTGVRSALTGGARPG